MVWVKIDDHFDEHPKWVGAPGDSIALWLAAMAWCNRNDSIEGYIPALKLAGRVHVRNLKKSIADLVERGAFHPAAGGYVIHDYPEYQQPEKIREIREKRAAAGRKGAAVRWGERARANEYCEAPAHTDADALGMANAIANAIIVEPDLAQNPNDLPTGNQPVDNPVDKRDTAGNGTHPQANDIANAIANGCPVPRSPSSSSSVEQHPPHAYLSFAIEEDQRTTSQEDQDDGIISFANWKRSGT